MGLLQLGALGLQDPALGRLQDQQEGRSGQTTPVLTPCNMYQRLLYHLVPLPHLPPCTMYRYPFNLLVPYTATP